ncbi:MAG TPA: DUF1385 domain-containing protein [Thermoanaerobaculia bacterium]|nr:DUF1385 domain-containing protein [Thermoanaerobaculia bacterium]
MSSDAYALNPDMLVGGQAVLDGVMMRSARGFAVAVRRPDGSVAIDRAPVPAPARRYPFLRLPVLRGSAVLLQSLFLGFRALAFAAHHSAAPEERPAGSTDRATSAAIAGAMIVAVLFGIGLFLFLPLLATNAIKARFDAGMGTFAFNAIDGGIRVVLFFAYLLAISRMRDIQRVFEYHGAEHKVVYTFEAGESLTVENARTKSRLHPRCGTSFLLFVLALSVALFAFVPSSAPLAAKLASRLVLIPLIAGLAYETIRFSSRHVENPAFRLLIAPGLLLQKITTREPDDSQIEIALTALREALVFDAADPTRAAVL